MFDYPNSPTTNQVANSVAGAPYTWDGHKWTGGSVSGASSTTPLMDATAAVGVGTTWARADHVHPSDTSRLPLTGGTLSGALSATDLTLTDPAGLLLMQSVAASPPTFSTRATGTRFVLYNALGASSVDYALGVDGNVLWFSVPTTAGNYHWFAGTTQVASLGGNSSFALNSATGSYWLGSNQVVGPQIAGWGTPTGGTRTSNFPGASATAAQTAATLAQLILDLKTHGLLGA